MPAAWSVITNGQTCQPCAGILQSSHSFKTHSSSSNDSLVLELGERLLRLGHGGDAFHRLPAGFLASVLILNRQAGDELAVAPSESPDWLLATVEDFLI